MKTILKRGGGRQSRALADCNITLADFFWPQAVIAGLTLLVVTLGIHFAVDAFDRQSELREQTLARNGIALRIDEVAQMIVPQVDWDDAVRFLDNSFDESWAEANIGKYLHQTNGFERSFVLDAQDEPVFASINGDRTAVTSFEPLAPLAGPLVQSVRRLEARRGPIQPGKRSGMISDPIQANALKMVNGRMAIMTASLVQPDFGTAMPKGARSPIVVTTMEVGPEFLELFSKRFLFDGIRVRTLDQPRQAGETEIAARDGRGNLIAWFAWRPLNPGYSMLRQLLPPILLVCAALGLVALTQIRRIKVFAEELISREAHSHRLAYYDQPTGLPNRLHFSEQLALEVVGIGKDMPSLAILSVSFDGMRDIVDQFGVATGDGFMRVAAKRLGSVCRGADVIARISDESFAILSLGAGEQEARILADRLRNAMNEPLALETGRIALDCRVGMAIIVDDEADVAQILRLAEANTVERTEAEPLPIA